MLKIFVSKPIIDDVSNKDVQTIDQERTYIEVLVPNSEDESVTAETKVLLMNSQLFCLWLTSNKKNRPQKQPSPGSIKNKERINTPKKRFKRQPCAGVTVNSGDRNATSEARTFKSRQKGDTSQDLVSLRPRSYSSPLNYVIGLHGGGVWRELGVDLSCHWRMGKMQQWFGILEERKHQAADKIDPKMPRLRETWRVEAQAKNREF